MVFAWSGLFVACLCCLKQTQSVRLVSPIYCFLNLLHWIIYVWFVCFVVAVFFFFHSSWAPDNFYFLAKDI